jgi:hypothetical protein
VEGELWDGGTPRGRLAAMCVSLCVDMLLSCTLCGFIHLEVPGTHLF